jgi:hypothetical protein
LVLTLPSSRLMGALLSGIMLNVRFRAHATPHFFMGTIVELHAVEELEGLANEPATVRYPLCALA